MRPWCLKKEYETHDQLGMCKASVTCLLLLSEVIAQQDYERNCCVSSAVQVDSSAI